MEVQPITSAISPAHVCTPQDDNIGSSLTSTRQLSRPLSSFRLRSPSLNSVRLRRIFDAFDSNGDGQISVNELGQALQKLGLPMPLPELQSAVNSFCKAGNVGLDFEDFAALHSSLGNQIFGADAPSEGNADDEQEEDLKEAFRVFDEDGDGFISSLELQGVLRKLGLPDASDVCSCEQMILNVDQNRDGFVDFVEFKHMMSQAVAVRSS